VTPYDAYMQKQALRAEKLFQIAKGHGIGGDWRYAGKMLRPIGDQAATGAGQARKTLQDLGFMPDELARKYMRLWALGREYGGTFGRQSHEPMFLNRGAWGSVATGWPQAPAKKPWSTEASLQTTGTDR